MSVIIFLTHEEFKGINPKVKLGEYDRCMALKDERGQVVVDPDGQVEFFNLKGELTLEEEYAVLSALSPRMKVTDKPLAAEEKEEEKEVLDNVERDGFLKRLFKSCLGLK